MPRRDDRGAVIPMVSLLLVALIGMSAFAVDLGMQRVARTDMQSLADAVALDVARLLDGRTAGDVRTGTGGKVALATVTARSVARNDESTLGDPPTVTAELVELDPTGAPVRLNGNPMPVADGEVPDGVLVTASTAVDFGFAGGRGGARRTALAVTEPFACFALGSYALAVDPDDAADTGSARLDEMLEDALQVQGLGYHGLADAKVSLAGLGAELGVATPDALMAVTGLRLRELFEAMATVLSREGGSSADVTLLQTIAGSAGSELDGEIDVADLVSITSGGSAVLGTQFSVLDLVTGAAFASDGSHALDVPVLWSVPKFSSGATSLQVVQRPQWGCGAPGGPTVQTSQLTFTAEPVLHIGNVAGLSGSDPSVRLQVNLAGAAAALASVTCGEGTQTSPESVTVDAVRSLSTASLTIPITLTGDKKVSDVGLDLSAFGLSADEIVALTPTAQAAFDLSVTLSSSLTSSAGVASTTYEVPDHTYAEPEPVNDATPVVLPHPTISASSFTGTVTFGGEVMDVSTLVAQGDIDLTSLVATLETSVIAAGVAPFVDNVNDVLTPTAALLGLHVAGADLYGMPRPSCDVPSLRG